MSSEVNSSDVHATLAGKPGKDEATIEQEQSHAFSEQPLTLASSGQENGDQFKGAVNPYAAALADVFGLEAYMPQAHRGL